jgi:hypothetical protein
MLWKEAGVWLARFLWLEATTTISRVTTSTAARFRKYQKDLLGDAGSFLSQCHPLQRTKGMLPFKVWWN